MTATQLRRGRAIADGVLALVQPAHELLSRPCLSCTCSRVMVRELDPDPDCPGLRLDGCQTDTRMRARGFLARLGVPAGTSREKERRIVAAVACSLAHDPEFSDDVLVTAYRADRPAPVVVLREAFAS